MGPGENFLQYTTGGIFLDMVAQFKNEKVYFSFRHWGIWTQWQMDTWANGNMREGANGEINGSIQDNWDRYRTF